MGRRHSSAEKSEAEYRLFQRIRRGDVASFEAFCVRVEGPLFGYVLRLVKDRTEAEDIAQEAFLRLYRAAGLGKLNRAPRPYLFSIAHNLATDFHRRRKNVVPLRATEAASAAREAERSLLREQIDKALAALPESHRSAIMLREFGELSYADIANTLGATLDQVKVWIHRARKRLAELLDRDGQYVGERNNGA